MQTRILTSLFAEGFPDALAQVLDRAVDRRGRFAFVASDFVEQPERTDRYFARFLGMFTACGIAFGQSCVVDGRLAPEAARRAVARADVVWLAGGDTPAQYRYLEQYGLVPVLRAHGGVVIGMSAGAINMGRTAVCTRACGHAVQQIYPALGLVDFSVEPHFDPAHPAEEQLAVSRRRLLYGLCDEGAIVCTPEGVQLIGDVYKLEQGAVQRLSRG